MVLRAVQVYQQVHALLPGVHYSALAKVLSLKTPGKRKQERLPGEVFYAHAQWRWIPEWPVNRIECLTVNRFAVSHETSMCYGPHLAPVGT